MNKQLIQGLLAVVGIGLIIGITSAFLSFYSILINISILLPIIILTIKSPHKWGLLWGLFPIIVVITAFIGYPKGEILGADAPLHIAIYYIIACFVVFKSLLIRKSTFYLPINLKWLLLFLGISFFSLLLNYDGLKGLIYWSAWAFYFFIVLIMVNSITNWDLFVRIVKIKIWSSAIISLWGIIGFVFLGRIDTNPLSIVYGFEMCDRNLMAAYLLDSFFMSLMIGLKSEKVTDNKILYLIFSIIILICIIYTFSRSTFIAIVIGLIFLTHLFSKSRFKMVRATIILLILATIIINISPQLKERLYVAYLSVKSPHDLTYDGARKIILITNWNIAIKNFVFGVGMGNLWDHYWQNYPSNLHIPSNPNLSSYSQQTHSPHNIYLRILEETGIFGLLSFCLFLIYSLKEVRKAIKLKMEHDWNIFLKTFYAILFSYIFTFLFDEYLVNIYLWFFIGLFSILIVLPQRLPKVSK